MIFKRYPLLVFTILPLLTYLVESILLSLLTSYDDSSVIFRESESAIPTLLPSLSLVPVDMRDPLSLSLYLSACLSRYLTLSLYISGRDKLISFHYISISDKSKGITHPTYVLVVILPREREVGEIKFFSDIICRFPSSVKMSPTGPSISRRIFEFEDM